ncbi:MFS general substrate transporter [Patellaria atrata CBS 101060]|uniref:MFS general substrate transporter n=1 Tax=Patellaria atrata CBS 101060 TaxID=1346257 RepID=A0A9P4S8E6_9PEZI|nr:MFS general substrate transporter [Patellaria atrata CBS 101060]
MGKDVELQFTVEEQELNKATVRRLDFILLPFLALLFLFNSLDKSNIGNAETANFTNDVGLAKSDLNTAVAVFYFFFVTLQPIGAAFGRRYGMVRWVPGCMTIWGVCTALHAFVQTKWQLITLRALIAILEAGFYPVAVSYLSLFYTRFEFGRRLAIFYGQSAVAGAIGGVLAFAIFSRFSFNHEQGEGESKDNHSWKSWQILFLIEGCCTIVLAAAGFLWLPHNARTAWFLNPEQREWAEERIRRDRALAHADAKTYAKASPADVDDNAEESNSKYPRTPRSSSSNESQTLLPRSSSPSSDSSPVSLTDDRGLTSGAVLAALTDPKIPYLLICNILSAIPATAFSIFLPLVLRPLLPSHATDPNNPSSTTNTAALTNLLAAPPYILGAVALWAFTVWSDRIRARLIPLLASLAILLIGLTITIAGWGWAIPHYLALNIILLGTYTTSPLAVAWLANNTPHPGKRAIVLGINGWGNFAGVIAAMLFRPRWAPGYKVPFAVTGMCVAVAWAGYVGFRVWVVSVNERKRRSVEGRSEGNEGSFGCAKGGPGWRDRVLTGLERWVERRGWQKSSEWLGRTRREARQADEGSGWVYSL